MKKITLFLAAIFCIGLLNAQTVVFYETFGEEGPTSNPRARITEYTDYDNGAPVTFTESNPDSYADIRATSTINTHVWFPANRETDLIISNIPTDGYSNLKLSFDVAVNSAEGSNVNKMILYCNDVEVMMPSVSINGQNNYSNTGEISIPSATSTKLRFLLTEANNTIGFRLDNVRITSENGGTNLITFIVNTPPSFYVSNNRLMTNNIEEGTVVEIYSAVGAKVATSFVINNAVELNNTTLHKGIYIIKAGNYTQKVMF